MECLRTYTTYVHLELSIDLEPQSNVLVLTCGFSSEPQEIIEDEDNNVAEEWNKHMSGSNISFEDFVTCDDEVVTGETLTEEEILESVNNCIESDKDDDFKDEPQTLSTSVSIHEAKRTLTTVRSFIEQCSDII
ncbi:unnamed protein product [Euphydryas editha]|uniref:Uncharacterized protein n=1 Tax=Euphydryas editha TaxID=104508 RepID=A0AAU9TW32_EUPED|nr:unnamed protein product [Euphydryas editha]